MFHTRFAAVLLAGLMSLAGCSIEDQNRPASGRQAPGGGAQGAGETLSGEVAINGSSTVYPITQAVAEEFMKLHGDVNVGVGRDGTGGGFKKFARGECDINDASRPIKNSEIEECRNAGIEFFELKIAIDGLSVIVHPENDWVECLTVDQLKAIWEPGSKIQNWSEVDSAWPDEKIVLYGPDTASGTFDYFTEAICGESGRSRTDYAPSADDNVLVRGVSGDKHSLGYFGYAYYIENKDALRIVAIENQQGECIEPTAASIEEGRYSPLSRPLFLYVNKASLDKSQVKEFLRYYLEEGQDLVEEVGYVRLSSTQMDETRQSLTQASEESNAPAEAEE